MKKDAFSEAYARLNARQKEAVDAIDGPVMVIAGPGTGKTQVIALRIGNILKKTDTPADGVLCLTFTNSGVDAMRRRLFNYIGPEAARVTITTFHSFGTKLIEEFHHALGLPVAPKVMDDGDKLALVDHILTENDWNHIRPRGNNAMFVRDLLSFASLLVRERLSPNDFREEVRKDINRLKDDPNNISSRGPRKGELKQEVLGKVESFERTIEAVKFYELYQEGKSDMGLMDYDDILSYMVELVTVSDDVRSTLQERYLYVLVDEHQDSSSIQNEFLKGVWGSVEKPNIFAVGDDRQLIYGFSGASLSQFENFRTTFPGTKMITLVDNYRSTKTILEAAASLLESTLAPDPLQSHRDDDEPLRLVECEYPRDEIIRAGLFFKERISADLPPEECALLLPKNAQVRSAATILRDLGLPVSAAGSLHLFDLPETRFFLNVLRVIADPFESVALGETILDPLSDIPALEAHRFLHEAKTRDLSLDTIVGKSELFSDPVRTWGGKLSTLIESTRGKSAYESIQIVADGSFLTATDHETFVRRIEIVRSLLHFALVLEEKKPKTSVADFLAFVARLEEYGEDVPLAVFGTEKGVQVMTLHASKGLEFDTVWIAHMNERSLMSTKRFGFALPEILQEKIEEKDEAVARRELYVALTRAKRFSRLSYSKLSHKGGEERLAPIVETLPEEMFEREDSAVSESRILSAGPDIFVSSKRLTVESVSLADLRKLVAENFEKKKVSVTLLNNFFECPWRWYFRSFLEVPEPLSESLTFGSEVHKGIEAVLKGKQWSPGGDRLGKEAAQVVERFKSSVLPELSPERESERSLSTKDASLGDLLITGKIDLVERLKDGLRVTDFKTGRSHKPSEIEKEGSDGRLSGYLRQLAMYSYLLKEAGKERMPVVASRLYFLEEPDPAKALYETEILPEHLDLLLADMRDYLRLMKSGEWTECVCTYKPRQGEPECPYCARAKMYK